MNTTSQPQANSAYWGGLGDLFGIPSNTFGMQQPNAAPNPIANVFQNPVQAPVHDTSGGFNIGALIEQLFTHGGSPAGGSEDGSGMLNMFSTE
jgi:hypothetical protein